MTLIGRSNAINIAERLGLPSLVVQNARQLYGAASAEINEVTCVSSNVCVTWQLFELMKSWTCTFSFQI